MHSFMTSTPAVHAVMQRAQLLPFKLNLVDMSCHVSIVAQGILLWLPAYRFQARIWG